MDIGKRIKQLRNENNYTLKSLSLKTGLSVSFISDIENGRRNPSIENLTKIATALGVSSDYLLKERKLENNIRVPNMDGWDPQLKNLFYDLAENGQSFYLRLQESLTDEDIKSILKFILFTKQNSN